MFGSVKFPLYKDDGRPSIYLLSHQRKALANFIAKIKNGTYHFRDNPCICGGHDDILISEKDRYGIPGKYVLCRHCGLVRQAEILDDESTALFYRDDYRDIYTGSGTVSDKYFHDESKRGEYFYGFVDEHADISRIKTIFEAGCGAGWNLYAFHMAGKNVSGCDFGEKYIAYGRNLGMNLYAGEPDLAKTTPNSQDLVILSHVLEHLNSPLDYVNTLAQIISPGGLLLVQVPGIFMIRKNYVSPIRYLQNAHVYNFCGHYLRKFFDALGLEVICGDEECTFLMRKPESWVKKDTRNIVVWDEDMPGLSVKIAESLKNDYLSSHRNMKYICSRLLDVLGLKGLVWKLTGRR